MKSATLLHNQETEADYTAKIIGLSRFYHWRVTHSRPGMDRRGRWSTPLQGDAGFPDLDMTHGERHVYAEIKSEKGKLRPEQRVWLVSLWEAGAEVFCWKPSYWWQVVDVLSGEYRGVRA